MVSKAIKPALTAQPAFLGMISMFLNLLVAQSVHAESCDLTTRAYSYDLMSDEGLKRQAKKEDKAAQFELARRYEIKSPENLRLALKWYRRAGRDSKCHNYVFSGIGAEGRLIDFASRKIVPGLSQARIRYEELQSRRKIND